MRIALVTFDAHQSARAYHEETALPWPILVDAQRDLYRAYGMLRASFLDVWGPSAWRAYLREFRRGQLPRRPGADVRQRGGDVLIDSAGIIRLQHVGRGPADRPTLGQLLAVLRGVEPPMGSDL